MWTGYNQVEKLNMMELDFVKLAIEYVNGVSINEDKQHLAQELLLRSKKHIEDFLFLKEGKMTCS